MADGLRVQDRRPVEALVSCFLYLLILVVPPMTLGPFVWQGMFRFLAPAFPLALLLARIRSTNATMLVLVGLALLQGMLATTWTLCISGVVV